MLRFFCHQLVSPNRPGVALCRSGNTLGQEMFQYYLKIVATHTKNIRQKEPLKSSQYSVHEFVRRELLLPRCVLS